MSVNKEFINALKQWLKYDDLIETKNKELKQIKLTKDNLEQIIIKYIENNNLKDTKLNLSGNNIQYVENLNSGSLSFKLIEEALREYLKNEAQVISICQVIKNKKDRERKVQRVLKRKKIKQKKSRSKSRSRSKSF
jgi:hypothetical protein